MPTSHPRNWGVRPRFLNPHRIELARRRRGLTKTGLAVRLGVNPRTVSGYERSGAPLARGADLSAHLGFPVEFFAQRDPVDIPPANINFRAGRRATAVHRGAALAAASNAVEVAGWVAGRFVLPQLKLLDLGGADPVTGAALLRTSWGIDTQPIPNMVHLAEYFGIRAYSLPALAEKVDAFSVWSGRVPFIFIARRKTPEQFRFDIAHEIGHLTLHSNEPPAAKQEREADLFAFELLLPRTAILEKLPHNPSVEQLLELKNEYRVSAMMAAVATHRAGRLSDAAYRRVLLELHTLGYKHGEPDGLPVHEASSVFPQVFTPERFSPQQAADDLHLPVEEIHGLTFSTALHVVKPTSEPTYFRPPQLARIEAPQLRVVE